MSIRKRLVVLTIAGSLLLTGCLESNSRQELGNLQGNSSSIAESSVNESSEEYELTEKIELGEIDDYFAMVCSSVAYQLQDAGFSAASGAARTTDNSDYSAVGVYYYSDDLVFWDDDSCQAVGFIEVVNEQTPFRDVSDEDYIISVVDTNESENDLQRICTYNYEEIGSEHLVYKNKYITYYQQSPMRVVYSVCDNDENNYNLELGSLFDYDTQEYIYDESIIEDEYVTHTGIPLIEEIDYAELEQELQRISELQEKNGYSVQSLEISYISPENLQAYIDSQEEDTFFGAPVSELTKAFGVGSVLVFENGELHKAKMLNNSGDDSYKWSDCLKKCGIGAGALLFSAAVNEKGHPLATAIDFVIVLAEPLSVGIVESLHDLVIDTAANIENGASVEEAIRLAAPHALKEFSDKFYITAVKVAAKNTVGIYNPVSSLAFVRLKNEIVLKDPAFVEGLKTIVKHTEAYQTSVNAAENVLKKVTPNIDVHSLQNSITNTKQNFQNTIINTSSEVAEYITVAAKSVTNKTISVLMMPWTRQNA